MDCNWMEPSEIRKEMTECLEIMCRRCKEHEICQGTGCDPKKNLQAVIEAYAIAAKMP